MKAPFPWFGGKSRVADLVWDRFGNVPNYVEHFSYFDRQELEACRMNLCIIGACLLGRMNPTTKEQREVLDLLRKQLPEGLGTGAGRREA